MNKLVGIHNRTVNVTFCFWQRIYCAFSFIHGAISQVVCERNRIETRFHQTQISTYKIDIVIFTRMQIEVYLFY